MSYSRDFDEHMPHTITVDPWVRTGAYGTETNSTADRVSVLCRIEQFNQKGIDSEGNEVLSKTTVFAKPVTTSSGAFYPNQQDLITLPSTLWNPQTPPILAIGREDDEDGLHHWEIAL